MVYRDLVTYCQICYSFVTAVYGSYQVLGPVVDRRQKWYVRGTVMFMMTSSSGNNFVLLAFCAGNSPVTGESPSQRPVTRNFDVFVDLRLNKRLSKQSFGWWFETPSRSLWLHCNVMKFMSTIGLIPGSRVSLQITCLSPILTIIKGIICWKNFQFCDLIYDESASVQGLVLGRPRPNHYLKQWCVSYPNNVTTTLPVQVAIYEFRCVLLRFLPVIISITFDEQFTYLHTLSSGNVCYDEYAYKIYNCIETIYVIVIFTIAIIITMYMNM